MNALLGLFSRGASEHAFQRFFNSNPFRLSTQQRRVPWIFLLILSYIVESIAILSIYKGVKVRFENRAFWKHPTG